MPTSTRISSLCSRALIRSSDWSVTFAASPVAILAVERRRTINEVDVHTAPLADRVRHVGIPAASERHEHGSVLVHLHDVAAVSPGRYRSAAGPCGRRS